MSKLITYLTILSFCSSSFFSIKHIFCFNKTELQNELLKENNYDNILRVSIEHQVKYYQPVQQSLQTRAIKSLDGIYDFCLDNLQVGFKQEWHSGDLRAKCSDVNNYYRMPVPSAFNDITSNKTVRNYIGWLWYQTTIDNYDQIFPNTSAADNLKYIQFESVNYMAIVWVQKLNSTNGVEAKLVGSHVGGHLPFMVNLTEILDNNDDDPATSLRLTIAISNNLTSETIPSGSLIDMSKQVGRQFYKFEPDFDFFHFAGIIGSVNLLQLPKIHIGKVLQTRKQFNVNCSLESKSNGRHQCEHLANFEVYPNSVENINNHIDDGGQHQCSISSCKQLEYRFELWLDHEQLLVDERIKKDKFCEPAIFSIPFNDSLIWEPANGRVNYFAPKLRAKITLVASFHSNKHSSDLYEYPIAFRPNFGDHHQQNQLQGFGMHHEQLFGGRSMSQPAIMKDIYLLKQWGANVIRTSHYPYSREFLDACQENGIPVIAECSAVGLKSFSGQKLLLHKQLLREMMDRDQNNAAIIGWSVANEPQSQLKESRPYFESLIEFCREDLYKYTIDSDRFITAAIAQSYENDRIGDFLDVIMVNNYFGWYEDTGLLEAIERPLLKNLRGWACKHPEKRLLVSEFGADSVAGMHSLYNEIFSEEFQANLIVEHERIFDELFNEPNQTINNSSNGNRCQMRKFIGSMVWNFADFSTDVSLLRVVGNKKGIFTQDRRPKLAANVLKKIYLSRLSNQKKLSQQQPYT